MKLHLAPIALSRLAPERAGVVADLHRQDVADGAVVDALDEFPFRRIVAITQARDDRQVFCAGRFGRFEHAAHAGRVDGDRFFAEHMLAGGDGGLQMCRPKVGRRGQDDDVDVRGQKFFVGIEAGERAIGVDNDAPGVCLDQLLERAFGPIGKDVGDGRELAIGIRRNRVTHRAASPPAAADQPDLEHVTASGMGRPGDQQVRGERRAGHCRRRCFEKLAARSGGVGSRGMVVGHVRIL